MSNDRRAVWEENLRKAKEQYPSISSLDWSRALGHDPDVFAHVLGDVIRAEGKRSRPGKRPALERSLAESEYAKISGSSYSEVAFKDAFKALTHGRSLRNIAHKCGLQKDHVHRLLRGDVAPTFEVMEKVAQAFRKDPSYFVEYRVNYVLFVIERYLSDSPETATVWYTKMKGKKR